MLDAIWREDSTKGVEVIYLVMEGWQDGHWEEVSESDEEVNMYNNLHSNT